MVWALGSAYKNGINIWPLEWWNPPGEELVTFADYSVAPGALLYDFVPIPEARQLGAASSVAEAQAIIGEWYMAEKAMEIGAVAIFLAAASVRIDQVRLQVMESSATMLALIGGVAAPV
jgi:hypothetical protein